MILQPILLVLVGGRAKLDKLRYGHDMDTAKKKSMVQIIGLLYTDTTCPLRNPCCHEREALDNPNPHKDTRKYHRHREKRG